MLVLSRKCDERVRIYDGTRKICEVVVTKASGRISLGFEGNPNIRIVRTEIDNTNEEK